MTDPSSSASAQRSASSSSLVSTHAALEALAARRQGLDTRESLLDPTALADQDSSSRLHSIASEPSLGSRVSTTQSLPSAHEPQHHHAPQHQNHQNHHGTGYHHESPTRPSGADSPAQMYASSAEADLEDGRDNLAERLFVQARYDFVKTDPSALSFNAGDIIEVLARLESGWWDGQLNGVRGWFPSNFVEFIDTDYALSILYEQEMSDEGEAQPSGTGLLRSDHGLDVRGHGRVDMDEPAEARRERGDTFTWGDVMGKQAWEGEGDLDDLARQIMREAGAEDEFAAAAVERRQRLEERDQAIMESMSTLGMNDLGPEHMDEFGVIRRGSQAGRKDGDAEQTLTLRPNAVGGLADEPTAGQDEPFAEGSVEVAEKDDGQAESAWEPTLTPDGQIYYHNTITGEDSWHLPPPESAEDEEEDYYDDNDFFNSFTGPSSASHEETSAPSRTLESSAETFQPPPQLQNQPLPHPWIARMSDDGREWLYINRITGQETRHRPTFDGTDDRTERLGNDSYGILPVRPSRPRTRASVDMRRKDVAEWCARTRREFESSLTWPERQTMAWHVDVAQDALQEVRELAMQGGEAEEEISRATDAMGQAAADEARARKDAARDMLQDAYDAYKQSLRNLLTVFGYVGPMDGIIEMPRPKWADERTMLGAQGMLASSVHAVIYSNKAPDGVSNVWQALKRDVNKCQDVLDGFPALVTPNAPPDVQHGIIGKHAIARFSVDGAGLILGGRWGFGSLEDAQALRLLDEAAINQVQAARDTYDATDTTSLLDVIRAASKVKALVLGIDIASSVDVDGDLSDRTAPGLAAAYHELVVRAGNGLLDMEEAVAGIDELCASYPYVDERDAAGLREKLTPWIRLASDAAGTLLQVSLEQKAVSGKGGMLDQIGHRSPRYKASKPTSSRPHSIVSNASKLSRFSVDRSRVKGLEEEVLDGNEGHGELESERRDRAGELISASTNGSQSSLALQLQQQQGRRGDTTAMSAASSTTSLGFGQAESDGGSLRSKRTSFMKFMKGRSSMDDDGRATSRHKKKLAKIFGEDVYALPPNGTQGPGPSVPLPLPSYAPPETPWYLAEDYAPEDVVWDDKGSLRGGTLEALIARLTPHGSTDTAFFQAFLLTFRSFTTGRELIELLIRRYHIEPPEGLNAVQLADWKRMKQTPIHLRVSNTIRSWLDVHYLAAEDADVLDRIEEFASTTLLDNGSELLSKQLVSLVRRRRQGEGDLQRRVISGGLLSPPAPLLPRVSMGKSIKLTDVNPIELARQLTILEFQHFQAIKPVECLNKAWQNNENKHLAPNVRQVIKLANLLSSWVCTHILGAKETKLRAGIMKYFIQTATELRNLNNFSSMASVMAGLNSAPILRLKRTKELLSSKTNAQKAELDKMLDSTKNFQNYKDMLKTINPPCVPFFGFWLSALVFIEDGNKDYLQRSNMPGAPSASGMPTSTSMSSLHSTSTRPVLSINTSNSSHTAVASSNGETKPLINFFKRSLTSEILRDIQQYQSQPYNLARCKPVHDWMLKQLEMIDQSAPDMTELYDISLQLEPREREEERITRMLHDSGFI